MTTPAPGVPGGFESSRTASIPSRSESPARHRAVGTPACSIASLANAFDPSSCAAAAVGPKATCPRAASASTSPATSGDLGPDDGQIDALALDRRHEAADVIGGDVKHARVVGDARVARRAQQLGRCGERASARTSACSRPPPPTTRTLIYATLREGKSVTERR